MHKVQNLLFLLAANLVSSSLTIESKNGIVFFTRLKSHGEVTAGFGLVYYLRHSFFTANFTTQETVLYGNFDYALYLHFP